jgi:adenosine deaminase
VNSEDPAYFGGYVDENHRAVEHDPGPDRARLTTPARNSVDATFVPEEDKRRWRAGIDAWAG